MPPFREFLYQPGQLVPGTKLRVRRPLGYGGGGSVYEVWNETMQQDYVLKLVHPELLHRRKRSSVAREAAILAQLKHDNIVQIQWADWTRDKPPMFYLVMEKLEGHSLHSFINAASAKGEEIPLGFAINTAASILRALAYAHGRRVVHRDVKPANIFIHRELPQRWVAKLLDFGIGTILSDKDSTTPGFRGTYHYAAPEQLAGDKPTPACDIYSLGVVLYELLAGRGPFDDCGNTLDIVQAHLEKPAPPVSSWRNVPPALDALVLRLLDKDPARRPGDCIEIARTLDVIRKEMQGPPLSTDPPDIGSWVGAGAPSNKAGDTERMDSTWRDAAPSSGSLERVREDGRGGVPEEATESGLSEIHLLGAPLAMPGMDLPRRKAQPPPTTEYGPRNTLRMRPIERTREPSPTSPLWAPAPVVTPDAIRAVDGADRSFVDLMPLPVPLAPAIVADSVVAGRLPEPEAREPEPGTCPELAPVRATHDSSSDPTIYLGSVAERDCIQAQVAEPPCPRATPLPSIVGQSAALPVRAGIEAPVVGWPSVVSTSAQPHVMTARDKPPKRGSFAVAPAFLLLVLVIGGAAGLLLTLQELGDRTSKQSEPFDPLTTAQPESGHSRSFSPGVHAAVRPDATEPTTGRIPPADVLTERQDDPPNPAPRATSAPHTSAGVAVSNAADGSTPAPTPRQHGSIASPPRAVRSAAPSPKPPDAGAKAPQRAPSKPASSPRASGAGLERRPRAIF